MIAFILTNFLALAALIVSILAIVVSICARRTAKRGQTISVVQRLIDRAANINDAFIAHEVRSPYAVKLQITEEEAAYTRKATLLLHQLNLLQEFFLNKDVLKDYLPYYEIWARDTIAPWIASDTDLRDTWNEYKKGTHIAGREFIDWIKPLIDEGLDKAILESTSVESARKA